MIVRPTSNWLRLLFVWDGSVLRSIIPQLSLMLMVSLLALLTDDHIFGVKIPLDTAPFPLVGISLAIFLGFRNNASYARFVEARHIWGQLLIAARALTSQAITYLPADATPFDRRLLVRRLIAFVYALKHQLRQSDPRDDLSRYLPPEELLRLQGLSYLPIAMLDSIRAMLAEAVQRQSSQAPLLWMLDAQINDLAATVAGCERIKNTPIPYPYGVLVHRTVYMYCFLLPLGLVDAIGVATPLISVFVGYTLFALEAIAQQIAEPFGLAPNCLALNAMTREIERSLLEMCGEVIPQAIRPCPRYEIN
jgi:putative membrane protein